jgi:nitrate reductase beta subunit
MPHARALGGWRREGRGCPHGFFSFNQEEGGRVHMIMCERIGAGASPIMLQTCVCDKLHDVLISSRPAPYLCIL